MAAPGEPRPIDAAHFLRITSPRWAGWYGYEVRRGDARLSRRLFSTRCKAENADGVDTHAREELRVFIARENAGAAGAAQRVSGQRWDTSPGRTWVTVIDGEKTVVTFHRDEAEAIAAYERAVSDGADAFYAETKRMMMQRHGR